MVFLLSVKLRSLNPFIAPYLETSQLSYIADELDGFSIMVTLFLTELTQITALVSR